MALTGDPESDRLGRDGRHLDVEVQELHLQAMGFVISKGRLGKSERSEIL